MEAPDTRGAGGRGKRARGSTSTPGKLLGIVSSPLQLISKTVKGLVGSERSSPAGTGAATTAPLPPSLPQSTTAPTVPNQMIKKADDGPTSFSFPTLAGSDDSPPANVVLRPQAPTPPAAQTRPAGADAPGQAAASPGQPSPGFLPFGSKELVNGWSPAKLASLNFFLGGKSQFTLGQGVTESARPPLPAILPTSELGRATEIFRPYQGLTALLRAGPGGFVSGTTSSVAADVGASGWQQPVAPAAAPSDGLAARPSLIANSRYNPYGRPNAGRPPRPGSNGGAPRPPVAPPSQSAVPVRNASAGETQAAASGQQPASMAVASAQLPPVHPHGQLPPSGVPPRPPTAPNGVRLAPGQVAFSSGRTGTPLPKFGPISAVVAPQPQQMAQTPGGFRPLVGAVGGKRQRDSPAASPLMASGIRSLSEFKRRRQALPQQPRSILAGLCARTPRDSTPGGSAGDRTPGPVANGGPSSFTTPGPNTGGTCTDVPATETARKILETLENFSRAGDQASNFATPIGATTKPGAQGTPRTGPSMVTPLSGPFMPPLDRLDQNHYGGTPTPTVTPQATGVAGFVSGTTPSPGAVSAHTGHTPAIRPSDCIFDTPGGIADAAPRAAAPAEPAVGSFGTPIAAKTSTLPLSPIAVAPVASTADRLSAATAEATARATAGSVAAPARTPTDTAEPSSRSDNIAQETRHGFGLSTNGAGEQANETVAPTFSFREPGGLVDPRLRAANEVAGKAAAATGGASARGTSAPLFSFGAPVVGVDLPAAPAADAAVASTAGRAASPAAQPSAPAASHSHNEVATAAAIPLPDDDDDDEEPAPKAVTLPAVAQPPVEQRLQMQPFKPIQPNAPAAAPKRVGFVDQWETPAEKPVEKAADGPTKDVSNPPATPMASPGGIFVSSHAGITPFRPVNATTPIPDTAEKAPLPTEHPAFSFGVDAPAAAKAPEAKAPDAAANATDMAKAPAPSLGTTGNATGSMFSFGVQQPAAAPAASSASASTATIAPAFGWASTANGFSLGTTAPASAPAVSTQPAASAGFSFGATAPAFGAAASAPAPAATATAPAIAGSTPQFSFGAPSQPPASIAAVPAAVASAPSPAASSASAPSFGAVAPAASAGSGSFSFGVPAPSITNPSPTFSFGAAPATATAPAAAPSSTFGFSAPATNASSAPAFGNVPSTGGFGGGFGTASAPSTTTSFTFGAQSTSGPAPASTGAFGAPAASSSSGFSFGSTTPAAPSFVANAAAPSFGSAPASQPTFGTSAPAMGAPNSANPFGSAAPGFNAALAQPPFGMQPTGGAPVFGASAPAPAQAPAPSFGGFGAGVGSNGGAPASGMFTFGGAAAPTFGSTQPAPAPAFGQAAPSFGAPAPAPQQAPAPAFSGFGAAPPGGFSSFGAQAPAPAFDAPPPSPGGDAGVAFSLGLAGDPKDGRKRVKARRHGH